MKSETRKHVKDFVNILNGKVYISYYVKYKNDTTKRPECESNLSIRAYRRRHVPLRCIVRSFVWKQSSKNIFAMNRRDSRLPYYYKRIDHKQVLATIIFSWFQ